MLVLSHPTGNTFFRAAARAFFSAGMLTELNSSICWSPNPFLANLIPEPISVQLARRSFRDIPVSMQHSHSSREYLRLLLSYLKVDLFQQHEVGFLSIDSLYRSFDRHVASRLEILKNCQAVYAYEDSSLTSFRTAKRLGLYCFYDLPIGYWQAAQQIFLEERDLNPEWACTISGLKDSTEKLARKDEELSLADHIIVPSLFVRQTLLSYNACKSPVSIVPFGSPPAVIYPSPRIDNSPLRILYVGSLGQRKGLSYAIDAVYLLDFEASFTLIGKRGPYQCQPLDSAINRFNWIETLPHPEILIQMRNHDVLLLPSLFEGYALVISEALSQGLPVIATPNSGATESIRDGIEGFIVPIRDSHAIAQKLSQLNSDRNLLHKMRLSCISRALELNWLHYESRLTTLVSSTINMET